MCNDKHYTKEQLDQVIAYCSYCKNPILEGESYKKVEEDYYHYSENNKLLNCYFPEEKE